MEITNLTFKYKQNTVLKNISFNIKPKTITLLLGPNGAGKTTLLSLISSAESIAKYKVQIDKNATISFIPQKINTCSFVPVTPKNIIESDTLNIRVNLKDKIMQLVNWQEIQNKQMSELSEGNIKKVFLILALLKKSSYLILDEPTAHLDIKSQNVFYDVLNEIKQNENTSIIFSSNELHTINSNIDQVFCLNKKLYCEHINTKNNKKQSQDFSLYLHKYCNLG